MIGYYVHHQGSGHLQRLRCIAQRLRLPVTGLGSLAAPADWRSGWVQLPRDDEPAPPDSADVEANGRLHWAPLRHSGYSARMAMIADWICSTRPALMVVDVSVEVTVLARALGVPVVVVAMRGDRTDPAHVLAYDVAQALLAPWPQEFAEPSWPDRWVAKTVHAGAFSRFDEALPDADPTAEAQIDSRSVTCLLGGGGSDQAPDFARTVTAATPGWKWTFCGGSFGQSRHPLSELLARSQVVVTHAGQNAVAEVAALRRPAIVVAQSRPHDEQVATARALRRGGLAVSCERWPDPAEWPDLLTRAMDVGGAEWTRWNDHHGAQRAASVLDAFAIA